MIFLTISTTISSIEVTTYGAIMNTEKLSISLPIKLAHFVSEYQSMHACKSKSEVIQAAIRLLQKKELENFYRQAQQEVDPSFDITTADGLDDETW